MRQWPNVNKGNVSTGSTPCGFCTSPEMILHDTGGQYCYLCPAVEDMKTRRDETSHPRNCWGQSLSAGVASFHGPSPPISLLCAAVRRHPHHQAMLTRTEYYPLCVRKAPDTSALPWLCRVDWNSRLPEEVDSGDRLIWGIWRSWIKQFETLEPKEIRHNVRKLPLGLHVLISRRFFCKISYEKERYAARLHVACLPFSQIIICLTALSIIRKIKLSKINFINAY